MPVNGPINENQLAYGAVMPWHEGLRVKNSGISDISTGTLVYMNGVTTDPATGEDIFHTVGKADADGTAPANVATYVAIEDIAATKYGRVARYFVQRGVDTSGYGTVGDPAYLSATTGETTPTAPTTSAGANVQVVGYCAKKSASAGILVYDLRSNAVPSMVGGLRGTSMAVVADQAAGALGNTAIGTQLILSLTIPAGTTGNVDFTALPFKCRVHNVVGIKTAAAGGGAGTLQVMNGATTDAITDAISIDVADKTVIRATTIDDAFRDLAAAATIRVVRTRTASTSEAAVLDLYLTRVA